MPDRLSPKPVGIVSAATPDYIDAIEVTDSPRVHWIWIFVVLALAVGMYSLGAKSQARSSKPALIGPIDGAAGMAAQTQVLVHVAGEVHKPGVYEFSHAARVRDAVRQAGGPLANADLNAINLAAFLEDGQKVVVPSRASMTGAELPDDASTHNETAPAEYSFPAPSESTFASRHEKLTAAFTSGRTAATEPAKRARQKKEKSLPEIPRAVTSSGDESQNADPEYFEKNPLNLNTATADQLVLLPGIGPAMAEKILATRKEKGGFQTVDELDDVPGIGEKKLEALRPLVKIG